VTKPLSAVACNLDPDILAASYPLLEEARVEAIEWSFDTLFNVKQVPDWFYELLSAFSHSQRLIGHGVFFSLFSGKWLPGQRDWLKHLKQTAETFRFDHVTEHFGFMTGRDFHHGAPLNIPYTPATLAIGRDRLKRIQDAAQCPVGLENLAFSYSPEEVKRHGYFLEELLEPVNGFIILDLHNLYCQLHNFNMSFEELIGLYPLHRVREIHISGGSWESSMARPDIKIRRDTHDGTVPEEVFRLLKTIIPRCPQLKYVVLEQLGSGLKTAKSKTGFYNDFLEMEEIIRQYQMPAVSPAIQTFLPSVAGVPDEPVEDETLYQQQLELSSILECSAGYEDAIYLLSRSSLANTPWNVERWEPYMLETAINIAQKWKKV
jgi:uncharacterized protein (UPF0276 family)